MSSRLRVLALVFVATCWAASAAQAQVRTAAVPPAQAAPQPAERAFLDNFARSIEQRFAGKSVGYAVVAMLPSGASVTRAGGDARRAPDPFPRALSVDDKITVASVSKTMTAAAAMKLLALRKLSVDAPVWPYLPSDWKLGPNAKSITFRELLTHRAGIRCPTQPDYAGVRTCFETGIQLSDKAEQKYNNTNFAVFRILIPRLDGIPDILMGDLAMREQRGDSAPIAAMFATRYQEILNREVFAPAGFPPMFCRYTDPRPALSYKTLNATDPYDFSKVAPGEDRGDFSNRCGSAGWFFSARQLAIFMHALMHTSKILPVEIVAQMKAERLGLWPSDHGAGLTSHSHGGYHPGAMNRGEIGTAIFTFSNGLTVGLS
jgi:CubicO group peptidase (beta-lactamase class C family)